MSVKIPITFLSEDKRESASAMGFEEELEVRLGLVAAVGVRKARSTSPLRRGRRGLGGSGGSLGSRVERLRMETL